MGYWPGATKGETIDTSRGTPTRATPFRHLHVCHFSVTETSLVETKERTRAVDCLTTEAYNLRSASADSSLDPLLNKYYLFHTSYKL